VNIVLPSSGLKSKLSKKQAARILLAACFLLGLLLDLEDGGSIVL
jgi:hypothetical protein